MQKGRRGRKKIAKEKRENKGKKMENDYIPVDGHASGVTVVSFNISAVGAHTTRSELISVAR